MDCLEIIERFNVPALEKKFTGELIRFNNMNNNHMRSDEDMEFWGKHYNRHKLKETISGIEETEEQILDFTVPAFEDFKDISKNNIRVVATLTDDLMFRLYYVDNYNNAHIIFEDSRTHDYYFNWDWEFYYQDSMPIVSDSCNIVVDNDTL